jgi:pimeloyl-ACP methyl ester carboxylesterase
LSIKTVLTAATIATAGMMPSAFAQDTPSIVRVHGAWANGSSWSEVVPLLQAHGLHVVAVHNPASSFEADVAATQRVINDQPGKVILVGHSYGGAVITEAGNNEKVSALVYVAAFAPAVGQSVNAIVGAAPAPPPWQSEVHADAQGWLTWTATGMAKYFSPDVPPEAAALLAATQAPMFSGAFDGKVTTVAYASKPSWYVIADNDQIIPPPLQQIFADAMKATIVHVASSHVAMISQPQAVADAIIAAVDGVQQP